MGLMGGPWPCPRGGARLSTFPGSLCRPFGILPHQVSPYPRNILKSVTWGQAENQDQLLTPLTLCPITEQTVWAPQHSLFMRSRSAVASV